MSLLAPRTAADLRDLFAHSIFSKQRTEPRKKKSSSLFMAAGQKHRASGGAPKALLPPTD